MFIGVLLIFTSGCEVFFDSAPTTEVEAVGALEGGWPEIIVLQPASFRAFSSGAESDGWSSFFHGDLNLALEGLTGVPRRRVLAEQAELARDIERLAVLSFRLSYESWEQTGSIGPDSGLPLTGALAALDREDHEGAAAWLERAPDYVNPELHALAANLSSTGLLPKDTSPPSAIADCVRGHLLARSLGTLEPLDACSGSDPTVLIEANRRSGEGALHNPLIYGTRARIAESQQKSAGLLEPSEAMPPGLEYLLFSGNWSLGDFGAALRGQALPSLAEFGLENISSQADDVDEANRWIATLDSQLEAWNEKLLNEASEEGRQVAFDVQPIGIYRSGVLRDQARTLLVQGRSHQAMIFLNEAMDLERAREIGASNRPSLFVLRAEARLQSGRTREALDDLFIIAQTAPHLRGLQETLNDLAIMQSAGRSGDSKEQ